MVSPIAVQLQAPWNEDVMSPDEKKLADDVLWGLKPATRWHKAVFKQHQRRIEECHGEGS